MKVKVVYDEKNRVAQKQYRVDGTGHQTKYLYGEVSKQQKPGLEYGVQVDGKTCIEYAYDLLGRCEKKTQIYPSGKKKEITYTYVPGAKEGTTTALVGTITENGKETAYTYDGRGNILEICTKELDTGKVTDHMLYTYTGMNQVIREEDAVRGRTFTYAYDLGGNLLENKKYYLVNGVEELRGTDTYTYSSGWKDQLTSFNGKAITYDAMGNPLSYMGMNLTWEKGRQLKTLKKSGTLSQYVYDNDGRRIQKTVGDKVIRFYLDGDKIIAQKEEGGERMDFLYDEKGTPFAFEYQGKMYFYQTSLQGDIIGIVDSEGSQVVVYRYDAWGEVLVSSDASGFGLSQINPLRYRGYYYDQETGLYYLQTRYYDPKVRRFLNADDASVLTKDPEQLTEKNLYAYCDDNPVMYRDDTGMFDIVSGIFGAVTNVATTYFAAKVTGQECGVWDLAVAAFAGLVSGMTKSSLYITLVSAFISGVGTTIGSLAGGSDIKEALWKGGMTALCTAVSVNAIAGWKIPVSDVVKNISGTIFGIGNGLVTAGVVASFPYRKSSSSSSKKNISQNKRKSNPVVKNYKKTAKQKERARKYFMFKMNQLREG
nr:RHS repeat-associated core domain-containing protein [Coprococcus comes]